MQVLRKLSTAMVLAGCVAALPATARADAILWYSVNGSGPALLCGPTAGSCSNSVTVGGVTINLGAVGESGSPSESDLLTSTLSIVNGSGSLANITLWAAGNGFVSPSTGHLENKLGGSSTAGTTGTATLTSCAFSGSFLPSPMPTWCPAGAITTAPEVDAIAGSFAGSTSTPVISGALGTPYTLANIMSISNLSDGGNVHFANTTDVIANPEPTSMALMATGLFGLVGFARRRKQSMSI